jgi:hypothetical protein
MPPISYPAPIPVADIPRKPLQPLSETGKWIRASVGVGAGLATILASARSCGVFGNDGSHLTLGSFGVTWVGLAPAVDTARSIGDTLRYVATVTDRRGTALVGASIDWATEDPRVATVDSAGFVVARAPGNTMVIAKVGEKTARARVAVRPQVARLSFGPDSVLRVAEGGSRPVEVGALDARGHWLARGRARLRSSDTAVAVIDSGNALLGRRAGRASVVAVIDDVADSAAVEVVPVPGRVVAVKGTEQRVAVGTRLPDPVTVRVESRLGRVLGGVTVRFMPAEGAGSVRPDSAVSGSDGLASTLWTLGETPGRQRLVVTVPGLDSVLQVSAEADPSAANARMAMIGDSATGPAGGSSPVEVAVRVTDSLGRIVAGVPVAWFALDGGAIRGKESRTDSLGEAHADWRFGPRSGVQRAKVLVGSGRTVPAFTVTARALPGSPARLELMSARSDSGTVGAPLKRPIVVRVTDAAGNPVPDVVLAVVPRAGTVSDTAITTDAAGRGVILWTLGERAGEQRLGIRGGRLGSVEVVVRARPRVAANITFLEPPTTVPIGRPLPKPVRIVVTDVHGNPVAGQLVVFHTTKGTVSPVRLVTGKDGGAATKWTLARKAGEQALTVSVPGTDARAKLEIEVTEPPSAGVRPAAHGEDPKKAATLRGRGPSR